MRIRIKKRNKYGMRRCKCPNGLYIDYIIYNIYLAKYIIYFYIYINTTNKKIGWSSSIEIDKILLPLCFSSPFPFFFFFISNNMRREKLIPIFYITFWIISDIGLKHILSTCFGNEISHLVPIEFEVIDKNLHIFLKK